jgi:F420-dependent oxidoreductase-like protein
MDAQAREGGEPNDRSDPPDGGRADWRRQLDLRELGMNRPIRVGLFLDAATSAMGLRRQIWRMADDAGFDHIWHDDHLLSLAGGRPHDQAIYESWTMLAATAEATTRAGVGVLVTGNLYRNPGMLAKMATTVDHISGGRLEMGIGVGWAEPEFRSLGMPFPGLPDRIEMLDEACDVLKLLWTQARSDFDGRYYRLVDAISEPKPIQRPRPPIWIGAKGPKRSMRVVARHADVWNASGARGLEADVETSRILDEHCAAIGRDPMEVRRSVVLEANSVDSLCRLAEGYAAAGFSEIILDVTCPDPPRRVDEVAIAAMARIRQFTVASIG